MSHFWSEAGFPHKGWNYVSITDLAENDPDYAPGVCEACGQSNLRYIHTLSHDDFQNVDVGCDCAERLTDDYVSPREREGKVKSRAGRRKRWLSRKWMRSKNGGSWLKVEGIIVGVSPDHFHPGKWRAWIKRGPNDFFNVPGRYNSADDAKLAMFLHVADYLDW